MRSDTTRFIRGLFYAFGLGLIVLSFAACSSVSDLVGEGWGLRTSATAGYSRVKGEDDVGQSLKGDGGHAGVRAELTAPTDVEGVEVGLRFGAGGRSASAEKGFGEADVRALELSAAPVIRGIFPVAGRVSAYVEGFAGYAQEFGTLDVRSPAIGHNHESASSGGLLWGAGAGLQLSTGTRSALVFGLEFSDRSSSFRDLDVRASDIGLVVGYAFKF